jgi:phosphoribosyl-AMP cyclohydrolase
MERRKLSEEGIEIMIDFLKLWKIYQLIGVGDKAVIPVVVQDVATKEVLMLGYVNARALIYALKNKVATFWSTSRNELWVKGLTSGNTLELIEVRINCEQNSLLYLVRPVEKCGACHTKDKNGEYRKSCFYRNIDVSTNCLEFVNQNERRSKMRYRRKFRRRLIWWELLQARQQGLKSRDGKWYRRKKDTPWERMEYDEISGWVPATQATSPRAVNSRLM